MNRKTATMKSIARRLAIATPLLIAISALNSCETSGDPGASSSYYYSSGYNDPWYYGGYDNDADIIVTPPGNRPDAPLRPTHPIARPPGGGGIGGGGGMGGGGFGGGGMGGGGGGRGGGGRR